jgi:glycosyltransferase involved in cell wall biosynthesis
MSSPRFSIVMPTYNHARWIETSLRSIFDQNVPNVEVIVMDSVSTDGTPEILERYRDRISWVREKDKGQADAINRGFKLSRGEIVAWLNSDDTYLPGALGRVEAAFAADPSLDFVYGDALEIDENGGILTPNLFTEECSRERFYFSHDYICQPTLFLRRAALARVGDLRADLRWFLDYQWITRFFAVGLRGKRLPHFLAANRDHPNTKTNSGGIPRWWEIMGVLASTPRPGPLLLARRCVWIYSLEFVIKTINAAMWGASRYSSSEARQTRAAVLNTLNRWFMKLVSPQSFDDIVQRYHRDIAAHGKTVPELWTNSSSDSDVARSVRSGPVPTA